MEHLPLSLDANLLFALIHGFDIELGRIHAHVVCDHLVDEFRGLVQGGFLQFQFVHAAETVCLEVAVDGLIHLSDISWHDAGEEAVREYKKGQELEAVVLSVDAERERISLGIKQLEKDPFSNFSADNSKGSIVKGVIKEVDAKAAIVDLGDGIEGTLRASELARDRVEDARTVLSVGQEIEAKYIGMDRKTRTIALSIKAKDNDDERAAVADYSKGAAAGGTKLGDLLKEQMENSGD